MRSGTSSFRSKVVRVGGVAALAGVSCVLYLVWKLGPPEPVLS